MTNINELGNNLSGQTGTGSFVGSDSATLTGSIDYGSSTTLEIPNSATPSVSTNGDIAIDTTFTNFSGMITYFSGSQKYCPAILPADLSTTDGDVVSYNAASNKFVMTTPSGGAGKVVQYAIGTSSVDDTTSSTVYVDTSLTASITPLSASNLLWIMVFGANQTSDIGSSTTHYSTYALRRTTGTAADLAVSEVGFNGISTSSYLYWNSINFDVTETAGDTALHTYVLRQKVANTNNIAEFSGSLHPGLMIIMELAV